MIQKLRSQQRPDAGFTLVELLVAIVIMAMLGLALVTALHTTVRAEKTSDDESQGLSDIRAVTERMGRDIRSARAVSCDAAAWDTTCKSHLQLWIDYNSNYKIDTSSEIVTWELVSLGDGSHYKVTRTVNGVTTIVARSLIVQVAFAYDQAPTALSSSPTRTVTTTMTYDALVGLGTGSRNVSFTERLRNVV
jgi:prepilin-type N-terminal cleavage/methylation domain-containing protein